MKPVIENELLEDMQSLYKKTCTFTYYTVGTSSHPFSITSQSCVSACVCV